MIYIINNTLPQMIHVPITQKKVDGDLTFIMRSTVNREGSSFTISQQGNSDLYYEFTLTLSEELQDGEYEFELRKDSTLLDCGLAMVGYPTNDVEYKHTIEYEQYESE